MEKALRTEVAILAQTRNLRKLEESGDSEIQKFYAGKTVLLTGGTGFLGKQLIEKLLRSCREIKKIYLLMRSKKGKDVKQRLQEQLTESCYDMIRKYDQNFGMKIVGVEGDVGELGLALTETDWEVLTNEVDIIFHVAATVRFNDPLKKAVIINARGTREVLFLAAECKNLKAFVHVSTAYAHAPRPECKEEFYPSPIPSDLMIEMAETTDEEVLQRITPGKCYTGEIRDITVNEGRYLVCPATLWYTFATLTPSRRLHAILTFLWHTIPAHLLDFGAFLMGKKRMFVKIYSKIEKTTNVLSYFTLREWHYKDENTQRLNGSLSAVNKELFLFDIAVFKWIDYVKLWYLGVREYIINDGLKDTDLTIKRQFWFRIGHCIFVSFYVYIFWKLFSVLYYVFKIVVLGLSEIL